MSPEKAFLDAFGRLTNRYRALDVWRDLITMFACSLSNPLDKEHRDKREALYLEVIKKYNKQDQELFPELAAQTVLALEEKPEQDFLGSIFMSLNLGDGHNGQIFTPYHVCELMAEMTMDDVVKKVEQDGYISNQRSLLRSWSHIDCRNSCCKEAIGKSKPELPKSSSHRCTGHR